jgi:hypothetical protein
LYEHAIHEAEPLPKIPELLQDHRHKIRQQKEQAEGRDWSLFTLRQQALETRQDPIDDQDGQHEYQGAGDDACDQVVENFWNNIPVHDPILAGYVRAMRLCRA